MSIHAEQNSILFAARYGVAIQGCTMYVTHNPCYVCSRGIINSGVSSVLYSEEYRDTRGLELLREAGVSVTQFTLRKL